MVANTQYSGGNYYYGPNNPYNIALTVPISLSCSNAGNLLWAVGSVYDPVTNSNLGSNNIPMSWSNGYYSGQLVFAVPMSVVGHQLQVQIQVYNNYNNGQYSGLVAASSPTVTVNPSGYYQPSGSYGYYNGYPNGYYNGYYYYYNGYPSNYYYYSGYPYSSYPYYSYPYYYSSPYYHYGTGCSNWNNNGYYTGCNSYNHHHHH